MILAFLLGLGVLALILQMVVPPLPLLIPCTPHLTALVVIYAGLKFRSPRVLIMSAVLGFLTDLLSPEFIGCGVISLSLLAGFVLLQIESLPLHHWTLQIFATLVGTFLYLIIEYLLYCLQIGHWLWPFSLWTKIVFDSLANAMFACVCYPIGDWLLDKWTHYRGTYA